MNLELLGKSIFQSMFEFIRSGALFRNFGQNFPEEHDGCLDPGSIAVVCRFNRWGSLLAVGCNDGRVCIFDFITRGVCKTISAHVQPVCSLSWSRNGRKLLTASADNTVGLWDVLSGECEKRFRFPSPILKVQFNPRDQNRFIVCPLRLPTVLVNANEGIHVNVPVEEDSDAGIVSTFDRRGRYILSGNGKGKISVHRTDTLKCIASFRLSSQHGVKSIDAACKGESFLTSSNDRVIRVFDLQEVLIQGKSNHALEPVQKLQDMVNKTAWKTCCLSGDGEYVCAGSVKSHSLYIWEKNSGNLVKILTGSKGEQLLDVQWHPARPLIVSVSNGVVTLWSQSHVENWSAFAPDFKELDENVEYEERESEFDLEDEDRDVSTQDIQKSSSEEECVDVMGVKPAAAFCSSDEDDEEEEEEIVVGRPSRASTGSNRSRSEADEPLWYLPIAPEVENPEENPYLAPIPEASGELKSPSSESNKRQKPKPATIYDIDLKDAPVGELHPLVATVGKKRAAPASGGGGGRVGGPKKRSSQK